MSNSCDWNMEKKVQARYLIRRINPWAASETLSPLLEIVDPRSDWTKPVV